LFLRSRSRAIALATVLLTFSGAAAEFDADEMERREDHTESLANFLHEVSFAILQRDVAKLASHLASDLSASGLPTISSETHAVGRWAREAVLSPPATGLDRAAFLESWANYASRYESLDDVRIKVNSADLTERDGIVRADAKIKFFWLGRKRDGHRDWTKGLGRIEASRRGEEPWTIHRFEITEFHAKDSPVDLFDEISDATGTALTVPRWGDPGNEEFLAHGVAVADVNDDGLADFFMSGHFDNYLYVSEGDGTYANRAEAAFLHVTSLATAPLFLDYDNDGDSDLFLAAVGTQMLFENRFVPDGTIEFREVSESAGVSRAADGYSAVSADVNGDGFPDVYVCSYNKYGQVMPNSWSHATNGTPNLLFLNQRDGTFREVGEAWGVADTRWTYAAAFADLNDDGRQDLYLANDFGVNAFYVNEGDHFRDAAAEFGLADTGNGMGVSIGDYDNDGLLDVHVTNMSSTAGNRILKMIYPDATSMPDQVRILKKLAAGNTLYRNRGDGTFEDVSATAGPFGAGWAFGGGFFDFDNDGSEDLYSPNGFISGTGLKDT
jgi:hypothetical protein